MSVQDTVCAKGNQRKRTVGTGLEVLQEEERLGDGMWRSRNR